MASARRAKSVPAARNRAEPAKLSTEAPGRLESEEWEFPWFDPKAEWWHVLAGDFINSDIYGKPSEVARHRKGNETTQMIICIMVIFGSVFLPLVTCDTKYALGVIPICIGVSYMGLPHDLIRDDLKFHGMPIGLLDDFIAAAIAALGVVLFAKAHHDSPIEFTQWNAVVFCVVAAMLILCYQFQTWRWLLAGLWAIAAEAALFAQLIPYPTLQFGVILYVGGFLYNILPVDLIKDEWKLKGLPVGKSDDFIFGYVPAYLGMFVAVLGLLVLAIS